MGREAVKLRLNSQYVSGKQTTGKALTAMVLPADEKLQLHLGPVPLAKNAICFINEFDKMSDEDKDNLLEVMEEGRIDGAKYAMPFKIPSPTTIMVSANPVDNKWSSPDRIHLEDIPFSPLILSRFDIISVYRDVKTIESDREYAYKKSDYEESNIIHNYNFLRKLLEYQKSQSPTLSPEAEARLNEYYVLVRAQGNFAGNKRLWEVIYRISKAIARFDLKSKVDDEVATETIEFMNLMLYEFHASILVTPDPFNAAVAETIKVIQSQEKMPIILLEAVKAACNRNKQAHDYIGNIFVQRDNKNLRNVMKRIIDNPSIIRVGLNPITVKWQSQSESDPSDLNDSKKTSPPKKTKKTQVREKSESNNGEDFSRSPRSPRSPSTKEQLVIKAKAITKTKTKLTEPAICDRVSEAETKIEQAHPDTGNRDFYPSEINPDFNLDFSFGNFQCPECPLKTTSAINLNIHIESEHPKRHEIYWSGGKWSCRNCKERGDKPHMMETRCKPKK